MVPRLLAPSTGLAPRAPVAVAEASNGDVFPQRPVMAVFASNFAPKTTAHIRRPRALGPGNRPVSRPDILTIKSMTAQPDVVPMPNPIRPHLITPFKGPLPPQGPAVIATAATPRTKPVVN